MGSMAEGLRERPAQGVQPRYTRRGFGRVAGGASAGLVLVTAGLGGTPEAKAATLPLFATNIEKNSDKRAQMKDEFIEDLHAQGFNLDALGARLSDPWTAPDGHDYMLCQRVLLQRPQGERRALRPANLLEEFHNNGYDQLLNEGALAGVVVPPQVDVNIAAVDPEQAFEASVRTLEIPQLLVNFARNFRGIFETGHFNRPVVLYGDYRTAGTQRIAVQEWLSGSKKGVIESPLVGEAAKAANWIPQEVVLKEADVESIVNKPEAKLRRVELIEYNGRIVEFLEHPDSPIQVTIANKETIKKLMDRWVQQGKHVQVVFAPEGFVFNGLSTDNFFGNWIKHNGENVRFGLDDGVDRNSIPAKVLITPFTTVGFNNRDKPDEPYDVMNYISPDPSTNTEINKIVTADLVRLIGVAGSGFEPAGGTPPAIWSLGDTEPPAIRISKKA